MKITQIVDTQVEVEADIDIDDIADAVVADSGDKTKFAATRAINNFYAFMSAIPDSELNRFTPESLRLLEKYFLNLADRISKLEGVKSSNSTPEKANNQ